MSRDSCAADARKLRAADGGSKSMMPMIMPANSALVQQQFTLRSHRQPTHDVSHVIGHTSSATQSHAPMCRVTVACASVNRSGLKIGSRRFAVGSNQSISSSSSSISISSSSTGSSCDGEIRSMQAMLSSDLQRDVTCISVCAAASACAHVIINVVAVAITTTTTTCCQCTAALNQPL